MRKPGEWINHQGSESPVDPDTVVYVQDQNAGTVMGSMPVRTVARRLPDWSNITRYALEVEQ